MFKNQSKEIPSEIERLQEENRKLSDENIKLHAWVSELEATVVKLVKIVEPVDCSDTFLELLKSLNITA